MHNKEMYRHNKQVLKGFLPFCGETNLLCKEIQGQIAAFTVL